MFSTEDNELLCRVEGDAPMGRLMRQYWLPACMAEEVDLPDGDPVRVKLLGKGLVIFRDTQGRLGALDERCPHRKASLVYGRNEDNGLRCLYHGWKMDVQGNVVETPSEPMADRLANRIRHKAYPVHEYGRMVWVWLGDPDQVVPFEQPAYATGAEPKISIAKVVVAANWAQALEGGIDSSHSSSLHSDETRPAAGTRSAMNAGERFGASAAYTVMRPSHDKAPRLKVQITDYGMRYVALRKPIVDPSQNEYARVTVFIAPFTLLIPPNDAYSLIQFVVPMDDTHTMFYFIAWTDDSLPGQGVDQEAWRTRAGTRVGVDVDAQYRSLRTIDNNHLQDRASMRAGSFSGIRGVANQDIAMWESMGPISDRSDERLGASDAAVAQFRKLMVGAVRSFVDGDAPIGTSPGHTPLRSIRSYEGVVSKLVDWRTLGVDDLARLAPEVALGNT